MSKTSVCGRDSGAFTPNSVPMLLEYPGQLSITNCWAIRSNSTCRSAVPDVGRAAGDEAENDMHGPCR
jgi:hypothetical protein